MKRWTGHGDVLLGFVLGPVAMPARLRQRLDAWPVSAAARSDNLVNLVSAQIGGFAARAQDVCRGLAIYQRAWLLFWLIVEGCQVGAWVWAR